MYQSSLSTEERLTEQYIAACGENGAETIVDTWMDGLELIDDRWALDAGQRKARLRRDLIAALRVTMTDLELAGEAARLVGNATFEEFAEEQRR